MKVFSINPNTNKYFEDKSDYVSIHDNMYQGQWSYTPIYPLYTFASSGRLNYMNENDTVIEFYTMLPVKRLFRHYLVEIRFKFVINPRILNSLNIAIDEFNKFCEMSKTKINVNGLLS